MRYLIYFTFFFPFYCFQAQAQTKEQNTTDYGNCLAFSQGNYYIHNASYDKDPLIVQVGCFFEHKVSKHWSLGLGFFEWNNLWKGTFPGVNKNVWRNDKTILFEKGSIDAAYPFNPVLDAVTARVKYKMLDFYFFYRYRICKSSHYFNIGTGISYNWGVNSYLAYYHVNPLPPYDGELGNYQKKASYVGVIPQISYEYRFFKNRLSVGGGYRVRYYPGRIKIQHDFSFNTGLNF